MSNTIFIPRLGHGRPLRPRGRGAEVGRVSRIPLRPSVKLRDQQEWSLQFAADPPKPTKTKATAKNTSTETWREWLPKQSSWIDDDLNKAVMFAIREEEDLRLPKLLDGLVGGQLLNIMNQRGNNAKYTVIAIIASAVAFGAAYKVQAHTQTTRRTPPLSTWKPLFYEGIREDITKQAMREAEEATRQQADEIEKLYQSCRRWKKRRCGG